MTEIAKTSTLRSSINNYKNTQIKIFISILIKSVNKDGYIIVVINDQDKSVNGDECCYPTKATKVIYLIVFLLRFNLEVSCTLRRS